MADKQKKGTKPASAKGRQAADYEPPILAEPKGGPIPTQPKKAGNG